jgi:hypothetical protein
MSHLTEREALDSVSLLHRSATEARQQSASLTSEKHFAMQRDFLTASAIEPRCIDEEMNQVRMREFRTSQKFPVTHVKDARFYRRFERIKVKTANRALVEQCSQTPNAPHKTAGNFFLA